MACYQLHGVSLFKNQYNVADKATPCIVNTSQCFSQTWDKIFEFVDRLSCMLHNMPVLYFLLVNTSEVFLDTWGAAYFLLQVLEYYCM